ncbi:MAG: hypothetical protein E7626_07050 [Ruminococcaceae bacterium]|nr:hypothetical protein [Oscillospiraceae bacterium]
MKRKLSIITAVLLILSTFLTACGGDKAISGIKITGGLEYTYETGKTPDFSKVTAEITYNDNTTENVTASDLTFSTLDTSVAGTKKLTITYKGFSIDVEVTVKDAVIVDDTPTVTGIEIMASTVKTSLIIGETLDTSAIKATSDLSDGSNGTIDAENLTFSEIDTTTAGEKTLTVTYGEFSDTIIITVYGITAIEVDGDSIDTTVEIGEEIDLTNLKVYAVYGNDVRVVLDNSKLTITKPDTTTEGDKELVIAYESFEARLPVSSVPPTLIGIKINANSYAAKVPIGGKYDLSTITATASYSNNTTKQIEASSLTVSAVDTSVAGEITLSVTFEGMTDSVTVTVLGIKSVTIDQSSVNGGKVSVLVGTKIDFTKVKAIVTYTDDSKDTVSAANGLEIGSVDTYATGKQTLKVKYKGVEGTLNITVNTPPYEIDDVELPASLSAFAVNKTSSKFKVQNASARYKVGDDNPFRFALNLMVWDPVNDKPLPDVTSYIGVSNVYLVGVGGETLLTGKALTDMVTINNDDNTFDFTDAAVGKNFRIETRPRYNIDESKAASYTRSLDITVVDAYNVYTAKELNVMTNTGDDWLPDLGQTTKGQLELCNEFLANNNIKRPDKLAGIVIHNDINITTDDIPAGYLYSYTPAGGQAKKGFYDFISIFPHMLDDANPTFTMHGNYFSIYSYALPGVCEEGYGDNDDKHSSSELFRFDVAEEAIQAGGVNYDYTKYKSTVENLYLRGDDPNSNEQTDVTKHLLGLITFKTFMQDTTMDNVRIEAFMLGMVIEGDQQKVTIKNSIYHNAWQGHLYLWGTNKLQSDLDMENEAPIANYKPLTVDIQNSELTKCGGPVIVADYPDQEYAYNSKCGVDVNVDASSKLYTYVTGQEVWFSANGVSQLATQILAMNQPIANTATAYGTTAAITSANNPGMVGVPSANLIFANRGPRGSMTIEGKGYINMEDPTIQAVQAGLAQQMPGVDVPIFQSAGGGIAASDGTQIFSPSMTAPDASFFQGDTMSLYYAGMGVFMEYYHE